MCLVALPGSASQEELLVVVVLWYRGQGDGGGMVPHPPDPGGVSVMASVSLCWGVPAGWGAHRVQGIGIRVQGWAKRRRVGTWAAVFGYQGAGTGI